MLKSTISRRTRKNRTKTSKRSNPVDDVIASLPCVLLSIVEGYAQPLISISPPQKQDVYLCCVSDDGKRVFVTVHHDRSTFGCEVQCVDTDTWQVVASSHHDFDAASGTIFQTTLHLICADWRARGIACLSLDCKFIETVVDDFHDEMGGLLSLLPFKSKNVLISVRYRGQVQHLRLDHEQHHVEAVLTSKFSTEFCILAATLNDGASEIYLATTLSHDDEYDHANVIRVVNANSLVEKSIISCTECYFVRELSFSHSANSIFVIFYVPEQDKQGETHTIMRISLPFYVPIADAPRSSLSSFTSFLPEELASLNCDSILAIEDRSNPSLLMYDSLTRAFVRVLIPH